MKYIYENGARTFRGYFFWNRQPVDVTDRATLKAIEREEGFRRVEDEKVEEAKAAAAPVLEPRPILHVPAKRGWPLGKARK